MIGIRIVNIILQRKMVVTIHMAEQALISVCLYFENLYVYPRYSQFIDGCKNKDAWIFANYIP